MAAGGVRAFIGALERGFFGEVWKEGAKVVGRRCVMIGADRAPGRTIAELFDLTEAMLLGFFSELYVFNLMRCGSPPRQPVSIIGHVINESLLV